MRFGVFEFKPALLPSLFLLLGLPLLVGLGSWQLERADEKAMIIQKHEHNAAQAAMRLDSLRGEWAQWRYREVVAQGRYDLDQLMLLDNRIHRGRVGYHVLTPLRLFGSDQAVLVNRGWIAGMTDRSELPDFATPGERIELHGKIELPPQRSFRLGDAEEPLHEGLRVVQAVDLKQFEALTGYALLPVVLLLDPSDDSGFQRDWKPVYGIGPDKHRAYAMQWYSIALILVVMYLALSIRRVTSEK